MKLSIRSTLLLFIGGLILISSLTIVIINYYMGKASTDDLFTNLIKTTTEETINNTVEYFNSAGKGGEIVRELIDKKIISNVSEVVPDSKSKIYKDKVKLLDDIVQYFKLDTLKKYHLSKEDVRKLVLHRMIKLQNMVDYSKGLLNTYRHIGMFHYGMKNRDHILVKRMNDDTISTKYILRFKSEEQNQLLTIKTKKRKAKPKNEDEEEEAIESKKQPEKKVEPVKPREFIAITIWDHRSEHFYGQEKKGANFANIIELSEKAFDPHKRPWYKGAHKKYLESKKAGKGYEVFWTPVYVFFSDRTPGITCAIPIVDKNNELEGVFGVDMGIIELSTKYLTNLKIGNTGRVFLFNERAEIIAYAFDKIEKTKNPHERKKLINKELKQLVKDIPVMDSKDPQKRIGWKFKLTPITEVKDERYKDAFLASGLKLKENSKTKKYYLDRLEEDLTFPFVYHDKEENKDIDYIGVFSPFPKDSHWKWIVGIVVPEDDFLGVVKKNTYITIVNTIITLTLAFLIAVVIASKISKPLQRLADRANKVREFQLGKPITIHSSIMEMDNMGNAFHNMELGLRSFQKYVPADLVRYLVQSNQEAVLGGEKRTLSVFFSDIADFTTISERLSPEKLVKVLGEYLGEMSDIISNNKGTVDKYIGDAIMAFWGAPIECSDHAYLACKSAIENQNRLRDLRNNKWKKERKPLFDIRIGINTGELIVGNMGSENRLNYTAIGDTVNVASRLEAINKYYNTQIICSDGTQKLVKNKIVTRKLDLVTVKGKTQAGSIYEVIGLKDQIPAKEQTFIKRYEEALNLYTTRKFEQGLKLFSECHKEKPNDEATKVFMERCVYYIANPPNERWNGVYSYTKK